MTRGRSLVNTFRTIVVLIYINEVLHSTSIQCKLWNNHHCVYINNGLRGRLPLRSISRKQNKNRKR